MRYAHLELEGKGATSTSLAWNTSVAPVNVVTFSHWYIYGKLLHLRAPHTSSMWYSVLGRQQQKNHDYRIILTSYYFRNYCCHTAHCSHGPNRWATLGLSLWFLPSVCVFVIAIITIMITFVVIALIITMTVIIVHNDYDAMISAAAEYSSSSYSWLSVILVFIIVIVDTIVVTIITVVVVAVVCIMPGWSRSAFTKGSDEIIYMDIHY